MSECIFCSIARGKSQSTKIYENRNMLVFMDTKPITPGHLLIIPKKHAELLTELEDELVGELFRVAKKMATALKKSKLNCRGVNYILADGTEAGQEIFHVHLHVIPRYRSDGFWLHMPPKYENETSREDLEQVAAKIRFYSED